MSTNSSSGGVAAGQGKKTQLASLAAPRKGFLDYERRTRTYERSVFYGVRRDGVAAQEKESQLVSLATPIDGVSQL
jgi:hypothetical protein